MGWDNEDQLRENEILERIDSAIKRARISALKEALELIPARNGVRNLAIENRILEAERLIEAEKVLG